MHPPSTVPLHESNIHWVPLSPVTCIISENFARSSNRWRWKLQELQLWHLFLAGWIIAIRCSTGCLALYCASCSLCIMPLHDWSLAHDAVIISRLYYANFIGYPSEIASSLIWHAWFASRCLGSCLSTRPMTVVLCPTALGDLWGQLTFRLAWCCEHWAVMATELLQWDLACGTLFQSSCIIQRIAQCIKSDISEYHYSKCCIHIIYQHAVLKQAHFLHLSISVFSHDGIKTRSFHANWTYSSCSRSHTCSVMYGLCRLHSVQNFHFQHQKASESWKHTGMGCSAKSSIHSSFISSDSFPLGTAYLSH